MLFKLVPWTANSEECKVFLQDKKVLYKRYRDEWMSHFEGMVDPPTQLQENLFMIEKDVVRTDRSHPFYPPTANQDTLEPYEVIAEIQPLLQLRNILMTYTTSFPLGEPGFVQGMV